MATISFSGLASGIDSTSLIEALLGQERKARITPLEDKITQFQDTNSAFSRLKELLGNLQTAAQKFRVLNGTALVKTALSSDETIISASASNSAANGTYAVVVDALARNATYSFRSSGQTYASADAVINSSINNGAAEADRTVSIQTGQGDEQETVDVVLTDSSTLNDFVTQFNSSSTKAVASLVNIGSSTSPDYRVVITGSNQGLEKGEVSVTLGSEITGAGSGAWDDNSISQAQDASFRIGGVGAGSGDTITRSSNTISDVIPGITFSLQAAGSATISIQDDSESTASSIQEFVDAYNEVISFISENDIVTRDEGGAEIENIFGPLASTSLDENLLSALRSALTGSSTSGRSINVLSDLGITTERDGTLKFDQAVFESAMSQDPEAVRTITSTLGESLAATNGTIAQFTRFNGLIDSAFNSNTSAITQAQNRIAEEEKRLGAYEQALIAQYARLEQLISQLNSQQSTLASILPG